eukprot:6489463-Amphidinium_carterae.2
MVRRWSSEDDCEVYDLWAEGDDWYIEVELGADSPRGQRRGWQASARSHTSDEQPPAKRRE